MYEQSCEEVVVIQEIAGVQIPYGEQGKSVAFSSGGEANIRAAQGNGMPNSSKEQNGKADQQRKSSEGLGGLNLSSDQLEAKPSPFGITDLFLNGHAPVIEGCQLRKGILTVSGQPPGLPLPSTPYANHAHPNGAVLMEQHSTQIDAMAGLQTALREQVPSLSGLHHDLIPNPNQKGVPLVLLKKLQKTNPPKAPIGQKTGPGLNLVQNYYHRPGNSPNPTV